MIDTCWKYKKNKLFSCPSKTDHIRSMHGSGVLWHVFCEGAHFLSPNILYGKIYNILSFAKERLDLPMPTITTKGKHKRGDRGSTEEEANSSKRANMAAELNSSEDNPILEDEDLESTDEPSRAELKQGP